MRRIMIATAVCAAATAPLITACDTGTEAAGSPVPATSAAGDAPAQSTSDTPDCGETQDWSTDDTQAEPTTTDALHQVRAGKHDCYDRVVLDLEGPADVGYLVGYVPAVTTDGSGAPVEVEGGAALQVIVRAPTRELGGEGQQKPAETGDYVYTADQLADWASLRAVRFAGSFEGQSTLAVGVREKLPFHVSTTVDGKTRKLVIDIAHEQA
jgi:hypothetical protein